MINTSLTSIQVYLIVALAVWSLVWKGLALWKAAGQKDKLWFIVLLIVNSLGLLEILYLFVFSKRQKETN
jgi:hypothetical protein